MSPAANKAADSFRYRLIVCVAGLPQTSNLGAGGSNPSERATFFWSVPDTWVTVYSGDMGNTFAPKGFSRGSSLQVSWSKYPRS
jgi:hypothetical protein